MKTNHQNNCQTNDKNMSKNKNGGFSVIWTLQKLGKRTNRRKNGYFRLLEAPLAPEGNIKLQYEKI